MTRQSIEKRLSALEAVKEDLLTLLCMLLLSLTILPCTIRTYELRAGRSLKSGVPAMSYFAMGMQESPRAPGWYNGFNFSVYESSGMDHDEAVRRSYSAIRDRLQTFRTDPGYCAAFYGQKFLSQWTDGTYASRQSTLNTFGGRSRFFRDVYEGKYCNFYIGYCNLYQLLLFLGAACFSLFSLFSTRSKDGAKLEGPAYCLLLLSAFGGFLFHMIWEANSRYVLLYGLCLLPYGARGIQWLCENYVVFLRVLHSARNNRESIGK